MWKVTKGFKNIFFICCRHQATVEQSTYHQSGAAWWIRLRPFSYIEIETYPQLWDITG